MYIGNMNKDGDTALHLASSRGHVEAMLRLLAAGADTNIVNKVSL